MRVGQVYSAKSPNGPLCRESLPYPVLLLVVSKLGYEPLVAYEFFSRTTFAVSTSITTRQASAATESAPAFAKGPERRSKFPTEHYRQVLGLADHFGVYQD